MAATITCFDHQIYRFKNVGTIVFFDLMCRAIKEKNIIIDQEMQNLIERFQLACDGFGFELEKTLTKVENVKQFLGVIKIAIHQFCCLYHDAEIGNGSQKMLLDFYCGLQNYYENLTSGKWGNFQQKNATILLQQKEFFTYPRLFFSIFNQIMIDVITHSKLTLSDPIVKTLSSFEQCEQGNISDISNYIFYYEDAVTLSYVLFYSLKNFMRVYPTQMNNSLKIGFLYSLGNLRIYAEELPNNNMILHGLVREYEKEHYAPIGVQ